MKVRKSEKVKVRLQTNKRKRRRVWCIKLFKILKTAIYAAEENNQ